MGRLGQGPEPPPKSPRGGDRRRGSRPYAFVYIRGHVMPSEELEELLRCATAIAGRYMGTDRAGEFGRRNAVPGELLVRLRPERVIATADVVG
jgi:hypothetical protein